MVTSTLTDKGQTTVPQEVRVALGIAPRQRLVWEIRKDGSAVVRPMPSVMELAGSLKSEVPFAGIPEETEAATEAWVSASQTVTNRFGRVEIVDPASASPRRFYRANR